METDYGAMRAVRELTAIFGCQWSNGMLPQIRFMPGEQGYRPDAEDWGVTPDISGPTRLRTSGITQPPIMGTCAYEAFLKIGQAERQSYHADFLSIAQGLERYHDWLLTERDPWGENLVLCLHPWETGTDNSPAFDPLIEATRVFVETHRIAVDTFGRADTSHVKGEHRPTDRDYFVYFGLLSLFKRHRYDQAAIIEDSPFLLQDILFNSLLACSLRDTASLEELLPEGSDIEPEQASRLRERASRNHRRAAAVSEAINRKLWSERDGLFYSYDIRGKRLLETPTVSSLMPLMSGIAGPQRTGRLITHLKAPGEFRTAVPLPSTSVGSPAFNPVRYWSGPSWPVTNWLVIKGLQDHEPALAEELKESTLSMIAEGSDLEVARRAAIGVLELNSFGEDFTTPSRKQYAHAWLWDSAIVAISWPLVGEKLSARSPGPGEPRFWEYYHPFTGEPLGAPLMSWTASLFLELSRESQQNKKL